jgi:hypothetical protein
MHETPHPFPSAPRRNIFTVRQFSERYPAFRQVSLRRLIFFSVPGRIDASGRAWPANGFEHAIVRVGRRVLIDEERFFEWIESQQHREGGAA